MTATEKVEKLWVDSVVNLQKIRDLRAISKSTKKNKLTKIERHAALLVDLYKDLLQAFDKSKD